MLLVPRGVDRVVPDWFASQLREIDPNLIVYFNPHRQRWIIDRCTRGGVHNAPLHTHTPECKTTNVRVVQEKDGSYMPLCQQVLDELKASDAWSAFGNEENFSRHYDNEAVEDEARRERQIDALYREASADNRRQLLKAYDLTQRHDVHRVNQ